VCERTTAVETFARDMVLPHTLAHFQSSIVKDYCDPAGFIREQLRARSIVDRLREPDIGIQMYQGAKGQDKRRQGVALWLNKMAGGLPAFMIDKEKCPTLYEGFLGYFKYKDKAVTSDKPKFEKNHWSHVHEALQYMVSGMNQELNLNMDMDEIIEKVLQGESIDPLGGRSLYNHIF